MKQVGIAIVGITLLILIVLVSVMLINKKSLPESALTEDMGIFYQSSKLSTDGELQILVKNLKWVDISDVKLEVENVCSSELDSIQSNAQLAFTCLVSTGNKGEQYNHDITFNYTDAADGLKRVVKGTVSAIYS